MPEIGVVEKIWHGIIFVRRKWYQVIPSYDIHFDQMMKERNFLRSQRAQLVHETLMSVSIKQVRRSLEFLWRNLLVNAFAIIGTNRGGCNPWRAKNGSLSKDSALLFCNSGQNIIAGLESCEITWGVGGYRCIRCHPSTRGNLMKAVTLLLRLLYQFACMHNPSQTRADCMNLFLAREETHYSA